MIGAGIQFEAKFGAPQRNLDVASQLVFQAALHGAQLIVLPELSMSGYVLQNVDEAILHAQHSNGYQTKAMLELARGLNVNIVFGYVEMCENHLYNSAAIVGPSGLLANVRKNNLRGSDFLWATAGEPIFPVVQTSYGSLGALICQDAKNKLRESHPAYSSQSKFYNESSVDVLAVLTSNSSDVSGPDADWVGLVESVGCNVVVATRLGEEHGIKFNGGSCVIDRTCKVWNKGSKFNDAVLVGGKLIL